MKNKILIGLLLIISIASTGLLIFKPKVVNAQSSLNDATFVFENSPLYNANVTLQNATKNYSKSFIFDDKFFVNNSTIRFKEVFDFDTGITNGDTIALIFTFEEDITLEDLWCIVNARYDEISLYYYLDGINFTTHHWKESGGYTTLEPLFDNWEQLYLDKVIVEIPNINIPTAQQLSFMLIHFHDLSIMNLFQDVYGSGYSNGYDTSQIIGADKIAQDSYKEGFDKGYDKGNADGKNYGYQDGFNTGYNTGLEEGRGSGYDDGYAEGYDKGNKDGNLFGFDSGYNAGYNSGFNDGELVGDGTGYDRGYDQGYNAGYYVGIDENVDVNFLGNAFLKIADVPFQVLSDFLNFEVFGFNYFSLLCSFLTLGIALLLLRKFL